MFSIVVYSVAASVFGIPTSESHSLIAGLTGAAIAIHNGVGGVNFNEWVKVLYGLVLSLALGFFMGWIICKIITIVCAAMDRRRTNGFFTVAQIFGAAFMSFMHGAQDGQKFIGVLFLGVAFCNGQSSVQGMIIPVWLMLLCSTVMGVGTSVGGEKIIKSVGMDMVKLERNPGIDNAYKDKRHHGCRRRKETFCNQFRCSERYDADLDLYISGLRADQLHSCKNIYYDILGGENSGKETGFILF